MTCRNIISIQSRLFQVRSILKMKGFSGDSRGSANLRSNRACRQEEPIDPSKLDPAPTTSNHRVNIHSGNQENFHNVRLKLE